MIQFAEFHPNNRIRLGVYSESDLVGQKKNARAVRKGGSGSEVYSIFKSDSVFGAVGGSPTIKIGGVDGTRTRGLLRDRQAL